jgi:putative Holliday junction resolvase
MKYLGVDYGKKRIGVSYADELGMAIPLAPLCWHEKKSFWPSLDCVVSVRSIDVFVVGYPISMNETRSSWTYEVERFMDELRRRYGLPVYASDERLTSFQVASDQDEFGLRVRRNSLEKHRRTGKNDSSAATLILQDFLNERLLSSGQI